MCKNLTSGAMWHKNCRRQLPNLKHPPCGFNQYSNNTNGANSNSNYNDNNNDDNKILIKSIKILIMIICIFVIVNNFLASYNTLTLKI